MTIPQRQSMFVIPAMLLLMTGCGGSDRPALAPASGIVKLDGAPVEGATVTFIPAEGGRPGSGMTNAEGRYTIETYADASGSIVGEHKVAVMKISGEGAYALQGASSPTPTPTPEGGGETVDPSLSLSEIGAPGTESAKELEIIYDVPEKFMSPETSGLRVTVPAEGSDALNLDLTK